MASKQKGFTAIAAVSVLACSMAQASETQKKQNQVVQYIFKDQYAQTWFETQIALTENAYAEKKSIEKKIKIAQYVNAGGSRLVAVAPWARLARQFIGDGECPSVGSFLLHAAVSAVGFSWLANQKKINKKIIKPLWQKKRDEHGETLKTKSDLLNTMIGTREQRENVGCLLKNVDQNLLVEIPNYKKALNEIKIVETYYDRLAEIKHRKVEDSTNALQTFIKTNKNFVHRYAEENKINLDKIEESNNSI